MRLRGLLLGSIAALGLAASAEAADLGVLTALDTCDTLGISGLTISSDGNCLQITGRVSYTFSWGDYGDSEPFFGAFAYNNEFYNVSEGDGDQDWGSKVESWLRFVATAQSDFGPAKAVLKLDQVDASGQYGTFLDQFGDEVIGVDGDDSDPLDFEEAYVAIGDTTVLMAGKKSSIANFGDDQPFNFLGLFNAEAVDDDPLNPGVGFNDSANGNGTFIDTGGHVIQLRHDLGNGFSVAAGLERLNDEPADGEAGTAVGVLSYASEGFTAHATFLADDILDGLDDDSEMALHAGFTAVFDSFQLRGAVAANDEGWWNVLGTGAAVFDMFTLALSGEATSEDELGFGASVTAQVTDSVALNAGFRWFDPAGSDAGWQAAGQVIANLTETVKLTGEAGYFEGPLDSAYYGIVGATWAPGGGFTSSAQAEGNTLGAYKVTVNAAKTFE